MPYITRYYVDLKLVDGSMPTKKRLVFFDRRTDTKLLEISASNIPDDGIIETEALDKTIPAGQIYAIAFDDEGDRQLAGADKLSIKTEEIWVDKAQVFHVEYGPGQTTNERVSGAPLTITLKYADKHFVNGVLTDFTPAQPLITENGLVSHGTQVNNFKHTVLESANVFLSSSSIKNCPTTIATETTTANITHSVGFPLDAFGSLLLTYEVYTKLTIGIKKIGDQHGVRFLFNNSAGVSCAIFSYCFTTNTVISNSGITLYYESYTDPNFPDFVFLILVFKRPANFNLSKLNIIGYNQYEQTSYTNTVATNGWEMILPNLFPVTGVDWSTTLPSFPSTAAITYFHSYGSSPNSSSYTQNFLYSYEALNSMASQVFAYRETGNTILFDMQFKMLSGRHTAITLSSNNTGDQAIGKFMMIAGKTSTNTYDAFLQLKGYKADKTLSEVVSSLTWKAYDDIRVRAFGSNWADIPLDIKSHYGLTEAKFTPTGILVLYENLTKGTKDFKFDVYKGLNIPLTAGSVIQMTDANYASLTRGDVIIKYIKIWSKPLAADWVKI